VHFSYCLVCIICASWTLRLNPLLSNNSRKPFVSEMYRCRCYKLFRYKTGVCTVYLDDLWDSFVVSSFANDRVQYIQASENFIWYCAIRNILHGKIIPRSQHPRADVSKYKNLRITCSVFFFFFFKEFNGRRLAKRVRSHDVHCVQIDRTEWYVRKEKSFHSFSFDLLRIYFKVGDLVTQRNGMKERHRVVGNNRCTLGFPFIPCRS